MNELQEVTIEQLIERKRQKYYITTFNTPDDVNVETIRKYLESWRFFKEGITLILLEGDYKLFLDKVLSSISEITKIKYYGKLVEDEITVVMAQHENAHKIVVDYIENLNPSLKGKVALTTAISIGSNLSVRPISIYLPADSLSEDEKLYVQALIGLGPFFEGLQLSDDSDMAGLRKLFAQASEKTPLLNQLKERLSGVLEL